MQFEPAWNLSIVLVAGLAAMYVWYLLSEATLFDRVFAYPREHWGPLWNCPWCSGFWLTGGLLLAGGVYDPITHLATAAVTGFLGSRNP